jgi:glycosyltransferase involved in cell wall biosynthesis
MSSTEPVFLVANGAQWGGTERHVFDLSRGLLERDVPVRVVLGWERFAAERFGKMRIPVDIVPRERNPVSFLMRMTRYLTERAPQLVHLHGGSLPSLAARRAGIPIVLETRHGLGRPEARRRRGALLAIREQAAARCLSGTIAVCERDRQTFSRIGPQPVYCVPNGIRLDDYPAEPFPAPDDGSRGDGTSEIRMGFVGRLTSQKGLSFLLRALAAEKRPFRLDVAGSGPLDGELRRETRSLALSERVCFHGVVDEVVRYIGGWDLLVLPSVWEGCPYSVLESLACGRPVLGTRVGGMEDLISDGRSGWLADPEDVPSLSRALSRIPWDRGELCRMGKVGRAHVEEEHTLDRMVDRVLHVYFELGQRLRVPLRFEGARRTIS